MKTFIHYAMRVLLMSASVFVCSCGNDEIVPASEEVVVSESVEWHEPFHTQGASINEVKAYMAEEEPGFALIGEHESSASTQLTYTGKGIGSCLIFSFSFVTKGLFSVIATEPYMHVDSVIRYLQQHYSEVSNYRDESKKQHMFTNNDKSIVITTCLVSEEFYEITYAFVTK